VQNVTAAKILSASAKAAAKRHKPRSGVDPARLKQPGDTRLTARKSGDIMTGGGV